MTPQRPFSERWRDFNYDPQYDDPAWEGHNMQPDEPDEPTEAADAPTGPTPQAPARRKNLAPQRRPLAGTPDPGIADPVLAMIERSARDPAVDVAKFERLMLMKEKLEKDRASIAFAEAFAELQQELPSIDRKGQIVIYSRRDRIEDGVKQGATPIQRTAYATLDDIIEALREPLGRHGFSLRFEHHTVQDGRLVTTAIVRHRLGHEERASSPPLQHDSSGSKNTVQSIGSSLTYGSRYALRAVLPIVSHAPQDADDDGRAAGAVTIDGDQRAYIDQLLSETSTEVAKLLDRVGAPPDATTADLTVEQYQRGISLLIQKRARQAQGLKTVAGE